MAVSLWVTLCLSQCEEDARGGHDLNHVLRISVSKSLLIFPNTYSIALLVPITHKLMVRCGNGGWLHLYGWLYVQTIECI